MPSSLYHKLLNTPDVKLLLHQVEDALEAEAKQREEFYDWLSPDVKAEFINGEIIMHSPAKRKHSNSTEYLFMLLHTWVNASHSGEVHMEKALVALTRNDYEPDISFWGNKKAESFTQDTMRYPAPDLVVEVLSKSTESRDRGIKFQDYASHYVQEYWIIDTDLQIVEKYILNTEFMEFREAARLTVEDGLESHVLPEFQIPVRAIFEKSAYLETLRNLLQ
ncbi:MAG: Uma2 family endonuclease [Bacteroidota bacterium]